MKFSKDYPKLSWNVFTTIRQNKGYYEEGQRIPITTPRGEFWAEIVSIRYLKKEEITDTIADYDAKTSKLALINMLERWYGQTYNDFILITLMRR